MGVFAADFGYCPDRLSFSAGDIRVTTRDDLEESIGRVRESSRVDGKWIYAPPRQRIFVMPKTHIIEHASGDGPEHLDFLIWALSFFTGLRLTFKEAGFVDTTPIDRTVLVDFVQLNNAELGRALEISERYWKSCSGDAKATKRWGAAVHALFLAKSPQSLQYEKFIYLYTAIDACYALMRDRVGQAPSGHPKRIPWLCHQLGMPLPSWAVHSPNSGSEIVEMRSSAIHEALYLGEPLGFALYEGNSALNLTLEMGNLVSRFLVAILGGTRSVYVRSAVSTYQTHGLDI